jgi:hydroxymethylbilane synthase
LTDKGVFTKELEESLTRKEIDIAVHSLKDLPSDLDENFEIGAVMKRAATNDVLISRFDAKSFRDLREGAVISTGSVRRSRVIQWQRPDIKVIDIRGNVPTRLKKLMSGEFGDATILAQAGLQRLGLYDDKNRLLKFDGQMIDTCELSIEEFIPCGGQGAIAIEALSDSPVLEFTQKINHQETQKCIEIEREFLKLLGAGCDTPVGVNAFLNSFGDEMSVRAILFDEANSSSEPKVANCNVAKDSTQGVAKNLLKQMQIDI